MKIFLAEGTGFIGKNLIKRALKKWNLYICYNSAKKNSKHKNPKHLLVLIWSFRSQVIK